eukprot:TRINITY_DN111492_c0_g1_i1.p1 TRINITY_DN111492_c0_g1~~TRINITY_DN111492_c0_g1_i1.p1  ORF type:complete len:452 (+),score=72.57 TRINITY_DN111492_c0_g1_i1:167-1522(+)
MPGRYAPDQRATHAAVRKVSSLDFLCANTTPQEVVASPIVDHPDYVPPRPSVALQPRAGNWWHGAATAATKSAVASTSMIADASTGFLRSLEKSAASTVGDLLEGAAFAERSCWSPIELLQDSAPRCFPRVADTRRRALRTVQRFRSTEALMPGEEETEKEERVQISVSSLRTVTFGAFSELSERLRNKSYQTTVCGVLASCLMPLAVAGGGPVATHGLALAFCPFPVLPDALVEKIPQQVTNPTLADLEQGVLVATFMQGSLGLVKIVSGDFFSGSYALLLATLGYNARQPGPASNWLKTYVLISFINGTMSSMDLLQQMLATNTAFLSLSVPLSVNAMHASALLVPCVSYLGAYCGWNSVKMQRKVQMSNYQQQLEHMLANPPWPPPALPPQIVESMMRYSVAHLPASELAKLQEQLPEEHVRALQEIVAEQGGPTLRQVEDGKSEQGR